jgi:hypothetical protein
VRLGPQATLQEALDALERSGAEAAYVADQAGDARVYGVLTREGIERGYRMIWTPPAPAGINVPD